MLCPVCNGEMFDNTTNKKNPRGPDYKCKDKNCKYELDKDSGMYKPSEYGTGVWLPKTRPATQTQPQVKPVAASKPVDNIMKEKSMLMAYAKDLVVAQINNGTFAGTPAEAVIAIYKKLLAEL